MSNDKSIYVNEKFTEAIKKLNEKLEKQENNINTHKCTCGIYTKYYLDSLEEQIRILEEKSKLINDEYNSIS